MTDPHWAIILFAVICVLIIIGPKLANVVGRLCGQWYQAYCDRRLYERLKRELLERHEKRDWMS